MARPKSYGKYDIEFSGGKLVLVLRGDANFLISTIERRITGITGVKGLKKVGNRTYHISLEPKTQGPEGRVRVMETMEAPMRLYI